MRPVAQLGDGRFPSYSTSLYRSRAIDLWTGCDSGCYTCLKIKCFQSTDWEVSPLSMHPGIIGVVIVFLVWLSWSHLPGYSTSVAACEGKADTTAGEQVLNPGGQVKLGKLVVAAPPSSLTEPVRLSVGTVRDPRSEIPFPEFLGRAKIVSEFYSLAPERDVEPSRSRFFLLGIEVPEDLPCGHLGIAVLTPPGSVLGFFQDDDPSRRWDFLTGSVDLDTRLFSVALMSLTAQPQIFVLVVQP